MKRFEILLVDDDPLVRQVIAEEIEEAGHFVTVAGSGEDALARLSNGRYDLMLVDYAMPGMMGVELVNRVLDRGADMRIAFLTGYDALLTLNGRAASCPVISKSLRMARIIEAIGIIAAGGTIADEFGTAESRLEMMKQKMAAISTADGVTRELRQMFEDVTDAPLPGPVASLLKRLRT